MKKLRIKDIAVALNISKSTVSKALSDSYEISEETIKRVKDYANKNGYTYNYTAQNLTKGKSNLIGVVVSNISNTFFAEILEGILETLRFSSYSMVVLESFDNVEKELECIDILHRRGVDGIIISPINHPAIIGNLEHIKNIGCRIIVLDRIHNSLDTFKIGVDNFKTGFEGTTLLLNQGCQKILLITDVTLGATEVRLAGYKKALLAKGIDFDSNYLLQCDQQDSQLIEKIILSRLTFLVEKNLMPDGIFTATNMMSNMIVGILQKPEFTDFRDMHLMGYTNNPYVGSFGMPMSVIRQPTRKMGQLGSAHLLELLKRKHSPHEEYETIILDCEIVR